MRPGHVRAGVVPGPCLGGAPVPAPSRGQPACQRSLLSGDLDEDLGLLAESVRDVAEASGFWE